MSPPLNYTAKVIATGVHTRTPHLAEKSNALLRTDLYNIFLQESGPANPNCNVQTHKRSSQTDTLLLNMKLHENEFLSRVFIKLPKAYRKFLRGGSR